MTHYSRRMIENDKTGKFYIKTEVFETAGEELEIMRKNLKHPHNFTTQHEIVDRLDTIYSMQAKMEKALETQDRRYKENWVISTQDLRNKLNDKNDYSTSGHSSGQSCSQSTTTRSTRELSPNPSQTSSPGRVPAKKRNPMPESTEERKGSSEKKIKAPTSLVRTYLA